ncbi:hypothetical protein HYU91_00810 [Candidatus Collierbacteria bacterium]|nr:hypothetical protein [Candidatus Collierbacteria bacterium]
MTSTDTQPLEKRVSQGFKSLNGRLTLLEEETKEFKEEFREFRDKNLTLLDKIYKILTDDKQELIVTKSRVYENHEPRISSLEKSVFAN